MVVGVMISGNGIINGDEYISRVYGKDRSVLVLFLLADVIAESFYLHYKSIHLIPSSLSR